jgi:hypothetical protein
VHDEHHFVIAFGLVVEDGNILFYFELLFEDTGGVSCELGELGPVLVFACNVSEVDIGEFSAREDDFFFLF